MLAVFAAVFAAVFSLYRLPTESVVYASVLCAAAGAAFFALGYVRYCRKHRELTELLGRRAVSLDGLPEASGAVEEDYQALLRLVWAEKCRSEAAAAGENREREDYYTLWAHQIKTPIAAMDLLLQRESGESAAALSAELFRIEQYVEMALGYLRLGSDSTDYVLRPCDLDDILRGCARKLSKQFIMRRISLDFRPTGLRVYTDEKWLSFVIEQLLTNALKYTPEGGRITVSPSGRGLAVADTGIGIDQADLPRVFDKGFTGYNGREDKKATGLGLYLCRRVCGRLGHSISIASSVGLGTEVTLGFPEDGQRTYE